VQAVEPQRRTDRSWHQEQIVKEPAETASAEESIHTFTNIDMYPYNPRAYNHYGVISGMGPGQTPQYASLRQYHPQSALVGPQGRPVYPPGLRSPFGVPQGYSNQQIAIMRSQVQHGAVAWR
jgi:hypothetical protein